MYSDCLQDDVFKAIATVARQQQVRAYVIGGYVRDFFLQRPCKDIDVVVEGSGIALAEALGKQLRTKVSVFKNFGTAMLRYGDMEIEFVGARKESYRANSRKPIVEDGTLKEDQERRDFTINAMAFSLNEHDYGTLIDPFGGMSDLRNKLIRTPLEPHVTYNDDPLRIMRAIRFATQLQFDIVPQSRRAILDTRHRLQGGVVSVERIADELNKMMLAPKPSVGFVLMDKLGVLELVLPQVHQLKGVDAVGVHQHKDNFVHTLQVLDNVAAKSDNLWLRWGALLHDIAKPATKKYEAGHGWTFHAHEFVGARMVPKIFAQLKLPLNEKMKYVQKLVELHLRPIVLSQEVVTDSAVRRLLFDAGDDIDDLMMLCEADITSKNEKTVERHLRNFALVRQKLKEVEERDHVRNFQPPISGEQIMQRYGLKPSMEVGMIKDAIKEAILNGDIPNDYEAAYRLMDAKAQQMGMQPVD